MHPLPWNRLVGSPGRKFVAVWMLLMVAPPLARAQGATADAEPPAAAALEDLSAVLTPLLEAHDVPALGCAVVRGGRLVGLGAAGVRARGRDVAVTRKDLWHLGSCTKAMTATLCGKRVAAGQLAWSTTLAAAFPDLEVHEDLADATVAQLLSHRSGLQANPMLLWQKLRAHAGPVTEARAMVAESVLTRRPPALSGTRFEYSNLGYMIVGAWLEAAAGRSWEEQIRADLFAPLGMTSAGFGPPGAPTVDPAAAPTQPWGHDAAGRALVPGPDADNPAALGPAGTAHMTLEDWAKFVCVHLDPPDAGKAFLDGATRQALHTPPDALSDYALGFGVLQQDGAQGDVLQHAGSNTYWFCIVQAVPAERFAILVTCNRGGEQGRAACTAVRAALLAREQAR